MPQNITAQNCHGGARDRASIETEFGIFIAPAEDHHETAFAHISTTATTTSGPPTSNATTARTFDEAETFLQDIASEWAQNDAYPQLHPEAVTANIHPDLEGRLDVPDIIYHEATTHYTRTLPNQDAPF